MSTKGSIADFASEIIRNDSSPLTVYHRNSNPSLLDAGEAVPWRKTIEVYREVRAVTDRRIVHIVACVESGRLDRPRPGLEEASRIAEEQGAILVSHNLRRFAQSALWDAQHNPDAQLSADELAELHRLTRGVPLATVVDPHASEGQRKSAAIRRSGRAGRKRKLSDEQWAEAMRALEFRILWGEDGKYRYGSTLKSVAAHYGVTSAALNQHMRTACADGPGTWGEWLDQQAIARGYLTPDPEGSGALICNFSGSGGAHRATGRKRGRPRRGEGYWQRADRAAMAAMCR